MIMNMGDSLGIITGSGGVINELSQTMEITDANVSIDEYSQLANNKYMISRFKRKELQYSHKKNRLYY